MRALRNIIFGVSFVLAVSACGQGFQMAALDECETCNEQDVNAPIGNGNTNLDLPEPIPSKQSYFFPTYDAAMGISKATWDRAQYYYDQNWKKLGNTRYVTMINLGLKSDKKRFAILDLETGKIEKHLTSHGRGSDPDNDGYATQFSNVANSNMSSLGIYITGATYVGKHGRSLRLHGQEATNSNAYDRLVVVHGADYVSEAKQIAGRSLGCPALDNDVAQGVISKILGGSLLLIYNER